MKELEKTKRISIGAVLFILVVIIALLTYEKPKHIYKTNTKTALNKVLAKDYFVDYNEINNPDFVLVDVRNQIEYGKGHLEGAINISTPEFLNETSTEVFNELMNENKTVVLYGKNPNETNTPFLLLYQLGYNNIKILLVENSYTQNKLITRSVLLGENIADINAFINESQKNANITPAPKKKEAKKVVPIKKKKKKPVEGGC